MQRVAPPRVSVIFLNFSLLMFLAALSMIALPLRDHLVRIQDSVQSEYAKSSSEALNVTLSQALKREWNSARAASKLIDPSDPLSARTFANALLEASNGLEWIGIADLHGRVIAGTSGAREGENVLDRGWFKNGIVGGNVGEIEATETDLRLINLSLPLIDATGRIRGVLVFSIRTDWLADQLSETAQAFGADFQLQSMGHDLVAKGTNDLGDSLAAEAEGLGRLGQALTRYVYGVDGSKSVVSVLPSVVDGLPDLGLTLLVSVPAAGDGKGFWSFVNILGLGVVALFILTSVASGLFVAIVLRPIEKLASEAKAVATGVEIAPFESFSSRECVSISAALAALQPLAFRERNAISIPDRRRCSRPASGPKSRRTPSRSVQLGATG